MNMREMLKRSDTIVDMVFKFRKIKKNFFKKTSSAVIYRTRHLSRKLVVDHYFKRNEVKKLQIGSGPTITPGWLCTDVNPSRFRTVYLDATQSFPFADNAFDYIHSEHMIEHICWFDGLSMLKECRRVLKPGGKIRVATPDLEVILGLYWNKDAELSEEYVKWITDTFLTNINSYKASFVINNAFRRWGHKFLYDADLLTMAMREAGFVNVRRYATGVSGDANFQGIERHGINIDNEKMTSFETMVLEGDCPAH